MRTPDGTPEWLLWVEESLVGAALQAQEAADIRPLLGLVSDRDFRDPRLAFCWRAIERVANRDELVCLPTVAYEMGDGLDKIGAEPFLADLMTRELAYLHHDSLESLAELVRRDADRRRVINQAQEMVRRANNRASTGQAIRVEGLKSAFR